MFCPDRSFLATFRLRFGANHLAPASSRWHKPASMEVTYDEHGWLRIYFAHGDDVASELRGLRIPTGELIRIQTLPDEGILPLIDLCSRCAVAGLHLRNNLIDDAGALKLAQAKHLTSLTSLDLSLNQIGDAGAKALAQAANLNGLKSLDLSLNRIGDAGTQALANSIHLAGLNRLILGGNQISDVGVQALAQASHFASLSSIGLWDNRIGDAGAQALALATHFSGIRSIGLSRNMIGNAGAQALAHATHFTSLTSIGLWDNRIGDAGALALAQAPHLVSLNRLDLSGNNIDAPHELLGDIRALRRHFAVREAARYQPNPIVRCMVIGAPFSGKTCIAKLLAGEAPNWGHEDRTLGQRRYHGSITVPNRDHTPELQLDICDLGGQSLQFMMHGLFLRGHP